MKTQQLDLTCYNLCNHGKDKAEERRNKNARNYTNKVNKNHKGICNEVRLGRISILLGNNYATELTLLGLCMLVAAILLGGM